jgi:DamX protein
MDMEKSLVERIADVDDERRRTSTQVRKALLAHRDEVDQTLAAYRRALTVLLAVCVLLAAGLGWLVFGQQQLRAQSRDAQAAALAAARAVDADEAAGSAETDRLDERVQSLDERLGALDQRIATALDDDAVAAALSAMQDRVASVEAQLGAVREAQRDRAARAARRGAGVPSRHRR